MKPIIVRFGDEMLFEGHEPVIEPLGQTISRTSTMLSQSVESPAVAFGVWECTPGQWRRKVVKSEYSYIISGKGTFTADGEESIAFRAGDAIYFSPNTAGTWDIQETVRKHYFLHE